MRLDISDSLISGQPLYLLYSNVNPFDALPALMAACLLTQATGSVRLQVTGRPPTIRSGFFSPLEAQPQRLSGRAAATAPRRKSRLPGLIAYMDIGGAEG